MGQVLHGSATTTKAIRRAIQHRQASPRALAKRYGINPKTVAKWMKRAAVGDLPTGPLEPRSTVLSVEDEAVIVAFRRHTLLPLNGCLYALQATIPHLTRSSLHRCLQRHGISRLPEVGGNEAENKRFKACPIGFFHIDIAEVQTAEGKLSLFVAIDRQQTVDPISKGDRARKPGRRPHKQVRLRSTRGEGQLRHGICLPCRPDRGRAVQDPHHPDRQSMVRKPSAADAARRPRRASSSVSRRATPTVRPPATSPTCSQSAARKTASATASLRSTTPLGDLLIAVRCAARIDSSAVDGRMARSRGSTGRSRTRPSGATTTTATPNSDATSKTLSAPTSSVVGRSGCAAQRLPSSHHLGGAHSPEGRRGC